jgi:hypothetical protein
VLDLVGRGDADLAAGRRRGGRAQAARLVEEAREQRIDDVLLAAGIHPGDPSLRPPPA